MTPTLESVLFASATVALSVNKLSKPLAPTERLFQNDTLNTTVIFKYPNFDAAQAASGSIIPGLEEFSDKTQTEAVRTAIFVPKDAKDLKVGGFGIFSDDEKFGELAQRYIGLRIDEEAAKRDMDVLKVLTSCPSLDPFLLKEAFDLADHQVHESYISITSEEASQVRGLIQSKVRPIVAKALNISNAGKIESSSRQFLETIWDPKLGGGGIFISAFGVAEKDAPQVFSAWKGVAFFDNEFSKRQQDIRKLVAWLKSDTSVPLDYPRLTQSEKQQIDMFRRALTSKALNVSNNISVILSRYQSSYDDFIQNDKPAAFRGFLMNAEKYYWTLGGCNGVLAQVIGTWRRYMANASGGRFNFDMLERLFKVLDAILRSRSDDKQISL